LFSGLSAKAVNVEKNIDIMDAVASTFKDFLLNSFINSSPLVYPFIM
jgi:hypothetical protein